MVDNDAPYLLLVLGDEAQINGNNALYNTP